MKNSKSKGLALLALAGALSTSLYANCGMDKQDENKEYKCSHHMNKEARQHMSSDSQKEDHKVIKRDHDGQKSEKRRGMGNQNKDLIPSIVMSLNLGEDQKMKLFEIKRERKNNKPLLSDAFTDSEFDKRTYVEILKLKEKHKIEDRAEMMRKVYEILTPKQKKRFKVLLDLKEGNDMRNLHP